MTPNKLKEQMKLIDSGEFTIKDAIRALDVDADNMNDEQFDEQLKKTIYVLDKIINTL